MTAVAFVAVVAIAVGWRLVVSERIDEHGTLTVSRLTARTRIKEERGTGREEPFTVTLQWKKRSCAKWVTKALCSVRESFYVPVQLAEAFICWHAGRVPQTDGRLAPFPSPLSFRLHSLSVLTSDRLAPPLVCFLSTSVSHRRDNDCQHATGVSRASLPRGRHSSGSIIGSDRPGRHDTST